MFSWSQEAVAEPDTNAFPHSGSYSRRFCGGPCGASARGGVKPARAFRIGAGISTGKARCMPSKSPIDHWSPSHLFRRANTGPIPWWIDWSQLGFVSDEKTGVSSQTDARIRPGLAKADSHAATVPPDEWPLTIAGRRTTRSMNRTRSFPKLSRVYRPGVHVERPCPRRSTANTWKCSARSGMAFS
jgi:hypothetical protein